MNREVKTMFETFDSTKIAENTWIIHENNETGLGTPASYLVVGDECGIMIDNCYGRDNIRAYAETLTDKPVRMTANTHGHGDHAGANRWFDVAFCTPEAEEVHRLGEQKRTDKTPEDDSQVIYVGDGDKIELGNRTIEVFRTEGHSAGHLAFLDRKERLAFTGDNIGPQNFETMADGLMLWHAHCRTQPSLRRFVMEAMKLMQVRDAFDRLCWGHATMPCDATMFDHAMIAALRALINDDDHLCEQEYMRAEDERTGRGENGKYQEINHKRTAFYKDARVLYDVRYMFSTECGKPTLYW